jgi:hypothetical protein
MSECSLCAPFGGPEWFQLFVFEFDIKKANDIIAAAPREAEPCIYDPEANMIGIKKAHLDHVDPKYPGIVATLTFKKSGEKIQWVIDGNHRAARCLRDNLQFSCYHLTEAESYAVLREGRKFVKKPK